MKFKELIVNADPDTPITLQVIKPYFDDGYLDEGMRCDLIFARKENNLDENDNTIWLLLDLEPHQTRNKKLEQANYWDDEGCASLTATEKGMAPPFKKGQPWIEPLCVGLDENVEPWFKIIEK